MDRDSPDSSSSISSTVFAQPVLTSTAERQPDKHQQRQRAILLQRDSISNGHESESVSPHSLSACDLKVLKDGGRVCRGNGEMMCCSCLMLKIKPFARHAVGLKLLIKGVNKIYDH